MQVRTTTNDKKLFGPGLDNPLMTISAEQGLRTAQSQVEAVVERN